MMINALPRIYVEFDPRDPCVDRAGQVPPEFRPMLTKEHASRQQPTPGVASDIQATPHFTDSSNCAPARIVERCLPRRFLFLSFSSVHPRSSSSFSHHIALRQRRMRVSSLLSGSSLLALSSLAQARLTSFGDNHHAELAKRSKVYDTICPDGQYRYSE